MIYLIIRLSKNISWKINLAIVILVSFTVLSGCEKPKSYTILHTDYGKIKIELSENTPAHKMNFLKLVRANYYDNLLIHRVLQDMLFQTGDSDSRECDSSTVLGLGGPGYQIAPEISNVHIKGAVAAARSNNPKMLSNGGQFYIVTGQKVSRSILEEIARRKNIIYTEEQIRQYEELGGTPSLDGEYTVFGKVVEGIDVVEKIVKVPVGAYDRPLQDLRIKIIEHFGK